MLYRMFLGTLGENNVLTRAPKDFGNNRAQKHPFFLKINLFYMRVVFITRGRYGLNHFFVFSPLNYSTFLTAGFI